MDNWGRLLKVNSIVSSCVGLLTFGIYNIVVGILILCGLKSFKNQGLAIATGVVQILIGFFIIPSLIMSCFLQPADQKQQ